MRRPPVKRPHQPTREERLEDLVGWRTEGNLNEDPRVRILGTDTYAWLPGRHHLVHTVDVVVGDQVVRAVELIGGDDPVAAAFTARSFGADGSVSTMRAEVDAAGVWRFTGGPEVAPAAGGATQGGTRSTLTVDPGGASMHAAWQRSEDGTRWLPWMDVRFTREGEPPGIGAEIDLRADDGPAPDAPQGLRSLDSLTGTWRWHSRTGSEGFQDIGSTTMWWLPGGRFFVERGMLGSADETVHSLAVVGWDEQHTACVAEYVDESGRHDSYLMAVNGTAVTIRRDRYRFAGTLDAEAGVLEGVWESSPDGDRWEHWYVARLVRE